MPTEAISIRLNSEHVSYLRYLARFRSLEDNRDIPFTELVREAIKTTWPLPSGFDRFSMDMSIASGVFHS